MSYRFRSTCLMVLLSICGFNSTASSQIITITDVQYTAAAGGKPATSRPKGDWSIPSGTYKVVVDFGYLDKGKFKADATVNRGDMVEIRIKSKGGNFTWASASPYDLTKPKAGLHVRARILKAVAASYQDEGAELAATYKPIPIPDMAECDPDPVPDGSVRTIGRGVSPETFWAAVTPAAGEVASLD